MATDVSEKGLDAPISNSLPSNVQLHNDQAGNND